MNRPFIDGYVKLTGDGLGEADTNWLGTEYTGFTEMLMYNGGKNIPNTEIGIARLGYDCTNNILCIAAYLNEAYFVPSDCSVEESDDNSWVRFTDTNSYTKLKQSSIPASKTSFVYIKYPGANGRTIGKCFLLSHMQEHELSVCLSAPLLTKF